MITSLLWIWPGSPVYTEAIQAQADRRNWNTGGELPEELALATWPAWYGGGAACLHAFLKACGGSVKQIVIIPDVEVRTVEEMYRVLPPAPFRHLMEHHEVDEVVVA